MYYKTFRIWDEYAQTIVFVNGYLIFCLYVEHGDSNTLHENIGLGKFIKLLYPQGIILYIAGKSFLKPK